MTVSAMHHEAALDELEAMLGFGSGDGRGQVPGGGGRKGEKPAHDAADGQATGGLAAFIEPAARAPEAEPEAECPRRTARHRAGPPKSR